MKKLYLPLALIVGLQHVDCLHAVRKPRLKRLLSKSLLWKHLL